MPRHIIENYIIEKLPGVTKTEHSGYIFFQYGTTDKLPFATIALADNEYDGVSNLNRDGIFRLNIGVSKHKFMHLFNDKITEWDYTAINRFMPHPHYAAQYYICVLNPEGRI